MKVCGQPHFLTTRPHGNCPWYPLNKRLARPQNWSGCSGEEKNLLALPGFETWIVQPMA